MNPLTIYAAYYYLSIVRTENLISLSNNDIRRLQFAIKQKLDLVVHSYLEMNTNNDKKMTYRLSCMIRDMLVFSRDNGYPFTVCEILNKLGQIVSPIG